MKFTLEFDTVDDLKHQLKELLADLEQETPEPKKRGTKKTESAAAANANKPAAHAAPVPVAKELPAAPGGSAATKNDARLALEAVIEKKNIETAIGILKEFGAARFNDLKETDFSAFVHACGKAV